MNRLGRFREIIKNMTILLLLILATLFAVELPKQWYSRADEGLLNHITINDYSVSVENEPMNLEQKLSALSSDDGIVASDKHRLNEEEKQKYEAALVDEVRKMLDYGWEERIVNIISDTMTNKCWRKVQIIRVIDSKIHSFDLGILAFVNTAYDMPGPGLILFDTETGEILYMRVYSYTDIQTGYLTSFETEIYDSSEKVDVNYREGESYLLASQALYYSALSEYYGMDIQTDSEAYVSAGVIIASPFTQGDSMSETFAAIEEYVFEQSGNLNY